MRVSLFWRTFLLIAGLIIASLLATLQLVQVFGRSPPEQQLAWEVTSIVNLTRSALVSSQGERRSQLLADLARDEGARVLPLEASDRAEPFDGNGDARNQLAVALHARMKTLLGKDTRLAQRVNGEEGLWVSFEIEGDAYWLGLDSNRLARQVGPDWLAIAAVALILTILGATAISRLVNGPLTGLARAIEALSQGNSPRALREDLPTEIAEVNRRFNRLAADLLRLESDRALALAGISHDIRTPLARLRLEIELSSLTEADKQSMAEDIERIDRIVGQFVEFGRAGQSEAVGRRIEEIDVQALFSTVQSTYRSSVSGGELAIHIDADDDVRWRGDPMDLQRLLTNLVENAMRYGHAPDQPTRIDLSARRQGRKLILAVADHGPGVPADHFETLLRPFARLDPERGATGGSGLGLAIVNRIAQRYNGSCRLSATDGGGLTVTVELFDAGRGNTVLPVTIASGNRPNLENQLVSGERRT